MLYSRGGVYMDNEQMTVPYIVFEGSMARAERHIKRLVIALIIAVVMIAVTNIAWMYAWNSYEYVGESESVSVSGDGTANYIGDDGDITNGINQSDKKDQIPQKEER